jgi:hypothetical protein
MGVLTVLSSVVASQGQAAQPDGGGIRQGRLPLTWNTGGPKCMEMPEWQVHEYNPDLFILRQSGCTDYESPFYICSSEENEPCSWIQDHVTATRYRPCSIRCTSGCCGIIAKASL